jgi:hypothetical protein
MLRLAAAAVAIAAVLAPARPAAAQVLDDEDWLRVPGANTTGIMLALYGGFVPGITIEGKGAFTGYNLETVWASSYGISGGWGFTPNWMVYANIDRSDHEMEEGALESGTASLHHIELGARYSRHYRDDRLIGYANLAFGVRQLHSSRFLFPDTIATGPTRATFTARQIAPGIGAQWFFTDRFALDGNVQLSFGGFNRLSGRGLGANKIKTETSTGTRFRVGVAWYPTYDR